MHLTPGQLGATPGCHLPNCDGGTRVPGNASNICLYSSHLFCVCEIFCRCMILSCHASNLRSLFRFTVTVFLPFCFIFFVNSVTIMLKWSHLPGPLLNPVFNKYIWKPRQQEAKMPLQIRKLLNWNVWFVSFGAPGITSTCRPTAQIYFHCKGAGFHPGKRLIFELNSSTKCTPAFSAPEDIDWLEQYKRF